MKRRYAIAIAASVGWLACAFLVVPSLIRKAYVGEALPVLNALIEGQDTHSVEDYLRAWGSFAIPATATLVPLLALLTWQGPRLPPAARKQWARVPVISRGQLLISVAFLGLVFGLLEALRSTIGYWLFHRAAGEWVSGAIYWMAPLAASFTLFTLLVPCLAIGHILDRGRRTNAVLLLAASALCVYGFGRSLAIGLHWFALALVAAGVGVNALGFVARHRTAVSRRAPRALAVLSVILTLWALWQPRHVFVRSSPVPASASLSPRAPNILLIVWDTVRARSLSLYGYVRSTTPNLERLARRSVVFDAAVTTAPWTLPAHASLFTGLYHHQHSATRSTPLDASYLTLAEALSDRGYQTAGFVANTYWVGRGFGLDQGFEWYEDRPHVSLRAVADSWYISRRLRADLRALAGLQPVPVRIPAASIDQALLRWLDRRDNRPFFAFLNLINAHEPYLPPDGFGFAFADSTPRYSWDYRRPTTFTATHLQELRDAYDSCIYYLDDQLGVLLEELESRGLLDNTLLIVTADHGETIGEHQPNLLGHENNVYYDVLNVPLVVSLPSHIAGGTRSNVPISLADIPTTILDLVDAPGSPNPFPGVSLAPILMGEAVPDPLVRRPILSQANPAPWHAPDFPWPIAKGPLYSVVLGDRQFIVNARGEEQLFDWTLDPWERQNLLPALASGVADEYRRTLREGLAPVVPR